MISYCTMKTAELRELLLVADTAALLGIYFVGCEHVPKMREKWVADEKHAVLQQTMKELQEYFDGKRKRFDVTIRCEGTLFQQAVWREISRIPFGETITYAELAKRVDSANAVRAAGTATGRNPLSIVVPCHRVMGTDGKLRGYAGGLERKKWLLRLESR